ncbi:hypothetical protein DL98DRAFT_46095 [Cadophora sp. DSE1049]|nr:hypothetical protein DL98DRAFT_46095 [Cadophora sp. DSE1049]
MLLNACWRCRAGQGRTAGISLLQYGAVRCGRLRSGPVCVAYCTGSGVSDRVCGCGIVDVELWMWWQMAVRSFVRSFVPSLALGRGDSQCRGRTEGEAVACRFVCRWRGWLVRVEGEGERRGVVGRRGGCGGVELELEFELNLWSFTSPRDGSWE